MVADIRLPDTQHDIRRLPRQREVSYILVGTPLMIAVIQERTVEVEVHPLDWQTVATLQVDRVEVLAKLRLNVGTGMPAVSEVALVRSLQRTECTHHHVAAKYGKAREFVFMLPVILMHAGKGILCLTDADNEHHHR